MKPMKRLNAYSKPAQGGGVNVDIKGMALDLITVCKATGMGEKEFIEGLAEMWSEVSVEVTVAREPGDLTH